jgi:hypothetical protein
MRFIQVSAIMPHHQRPSSAALAVGLPIYPSYGPSPICTGIPVVVLLRCRSTNGHLPAGHVSRAGTYSLMSRTRDVTSGYTAAHCMQLRVEGSFRSKADHQTVLFSWLILCGDRKPSSWQRNGRRAKQPPSSRLGSISADVIQSPNLPVDPKARTGSINPSVSARSVSPHPKAP